MITKEQKAELVKKFGKNEQDVGCTAVQVAILTARINDLRPHFEKNHKDFHSNRGLLKMIGKRRSLLKFFQNQHPEGYQELIKELGLRK